MLLGGSGAWLSSSAIAQFALNAKPRRSSRLWDTSGVPDDLEIVTTVGNEAEAEMVAARLSEAGIRHMSRNASGGIRLGAAAARDVYVEARDLDRAREVLKADEGFSEEELAQLSDEAGEAAVDGDPR